MTIRTGRAAAPAPPAPPRREHLLAVGREVEGRYAVGQFLLLAGFEIELGERGAAPAARARRPAGRALHQIELPALPGGQRCTPAGNRQGNDALLHLVEIDAHRFGRCVPPRHPLRRPPPVRRPLRAPLRRRFSSSLSGASGDASCWAAHQVHAAGDVVLVAGHVEAAEVGPKLVLAVKYRYWPSRSNAGWRASLMPSVICVLLPLSSE